MGDFGSKMDEAKGRAKEATGVATDDDEMKREGKADQAKSTVKDKVDDVADTIKDKLS